jgi:Fur family transcriptional regulator, peroxide stress response regulator
MKLIQNGDGAMQTSAQISNYLSEHHIRPSYQRVRIFQYLDELRSHPTADEIYGALVGEIPTLSKTTVYNALELFVRERVAQPLSIEENQMRFDADVSTHGHFQCERCGHVTDFAVGRLEAAALERFEVHSRNVFFKGLCPDCQSPADKPVKINKI